MRQPLLTKASLVQKPENHFLGHAHNGDAPQTSKFPLKPGDPGARDQLAPYTDTSNGKRNEDGGVPPLYLMSLDD
jgi:hypothetical protein